jgi:hypothetical protein
MKKIIKPAEQEQAVYYSDFKGKCFGEFYPEATLSFQFDYGSKYDGGSLTIHLSDEEAEMVLDFIKLNLSEEYKKHLEKKLEEQQANVGDAIDARDYAQSDYYSYSCNLLQSLLK